MQGDGGERAMPKSQVEEDSAWINWQGKDQ